jgi:replicative DNA helicase
MTKAAPAHEKLKALKFSIRDDLQELTSICAAARRHVSRNPQTLIVIDYAQLVRVKADSRREEVEKVSRDLRLLAMELVVPIILLCQLNKEGDTRETMTLSMDATAMWQVEVVKKEGEKDARLLCIPWQRNGESGLSFQITFLGEIARFEDYIEEPISADSGRN